MLNDRIVVFYLDANRLPAARYVATFPLTGHVFGGYPAAWGPRYEDQRIQPACWDTLWRDFEMQALIESLWRERGFTALLVTPIFFPTTRAPADATSANVAAQETATAQLVGVPRPGFCDPMPRALQTLGIRRAFVVSGSVPPLSNSGGETLNAQTWAVTGGRSDNSNYTLDGTYNNGAFFKTAAIAPLS